MPYTEITKQKIGGKDKWCFRNKETGQKICADSHEKAVAAMKARYAHEEKYMEHKKKIQRTRKD